MSRIARIYQNNRSYYQRIEVDENGNEKVVSTVSIHYEKQQKDGFIYLILYDDKMNTFTEVNEFINIKRKHDAYNTRKGIMQSLKHLYEFILLYQLKGPEEITLRNVEQFKEFLQYRGIPGSRGCTGRTGNTMLAAIRAYIDYLGLSDSCLLRSHVASAMITTMKEERTTPSDAKKKRNQIFLNRYKVYDISFKDSDGNKIYRPKGYTFEIYEKLIGVMRGNKDNTSIVVLHLLMLYGFRIGMVLGLTREDIITRDTVNGKIYQLVFRNRYSDHPDSQSVKRGIHPDEYVTYGSAMYEDLTIRNSLAKTYITENTYNILIGHYLSTSSAARQNHPDRYAGAVADIVDPRSFAKDAGEQENHYLFLNKNGSRLLAPAWNKRMKEYLYAIDVNPKDLTFGINHGWRHFITLYLLYDYKDREGKPLQSYQVSRLLGHQSDLSIDAYKRMPEEQVAAIRNDIEKEMQDKLPEYKNMLNNL